jgi:hypothetical protein
MAIFYKKTLDCGCAIVAFTMSKENDTFTLIGHSYNYICIECKSILTEELLDDRLENIYRNNYKISKNKNSWIEINPYSLKLKVSRL